MIEKKEFYIRSQSGDLMLVEICEDLGSITMSIGPDFQINLDYESAYDVADALLIMGNNVELQ